MGILLYIVPPLSKARQSTSSSDLYVLNTTRMLAAVGLSYVVRCLIRLSQRSPYLNGLLQYGKLSNHLYNCTNPLPMLTSYFCSHMEEDIDTTVNSPPSDSFMSLEVGMSNHSNDAVSLCPPQPVYIPQRPPQ